MLSNNSEIVGPVGTAFIPMFITEILTANYEGRIENIDREGEIYSRCIHTKGQIVFNNGNKYEGQ